MSMGGDVVARAGYNHLIIAFYLYASLWLVSSCCHVFCTKICTKGAKNLLTDCKPLSERRYDGIPYGSTHAAKNIYATAVIVIVTVGTAHFSFEYLSIIMRTC